MQITRRVFDKNKTGIEYLIFSLICFILTFPNFDPTYGIGLDTSYVWALNHLFSHDYQALVNLTYPYGPLAFLKIPIAEGCNFEIQLFFYSIVKIWFLYLFIATFSNYNNKKILIYATAFILSIYLNIDYLLIGLVILYSIRFTNSHILIDVSLAVFVACIGLYIKSSIGISAIAVISMGLLLVLIDKQYKFLLLSGALFLFLFFSIGFVVLKSFPQIIEYIINTFKLSVGYSSALAISVNNNWFLLTLFIISVLLPFFFIKEKRGKDVLLLLQPVLFATWKHAISRQDYSHTRLMFLFLFLYWAIILMEAGIKKKWVLSFFLVSICSFYINMTNTWNFTLQVPDHKGVKHFYHTVFNLSERKEMWQRESANNIIGSIIDSSITKVIGSSSIDSYPWELSYFSANKQLNWKARKTLQSGSFDAWLDKINADDFNYQNGPDFLILHYSRDRYGGYLGSIDDRYLLNDNPLTIINVLNYYSLIEKSEQFLLFRKSKDRSFTDLNVEEMHYTNWDNWIQVPLYEEVITRARVFVKYSLWGMIKYFLYKSDIYFIDYMLEDGVVLTYRFIPENAGDGIWIDPFIRYPNNDTTEPRVTKIRFRCSDKISNVEKLTYQLERITVNKEKHTNSALSLFHKKTNLADHMVSTNTISFDDQ